MIMTAFIYHLNKAKMNQKDVEARGCMRLLEHHDNFPIANELHQEYLESAQKRDSPNNGHSSEDRQREEGQRVKGRTYWLHYWTTTACALFVLLVNAYIFVSLWFPHGYKSDPPFYVTPTAAMAAIALGIPYWMGLKLYKKRWPFATKDQWEFVINRTIMAERIDGRYCLRREKLVQEWRERGQLEREPVF